MSGLQWLFIIGAGFAGFFAVSYLIDRSRRSEKPAANPERPVEAQPEVQQQALGESAWEEFRRKDRTDR